MSVQPSPQSTPVALTVAGSDCSGGAGLQADLKTFQTLGVYGLSAVTCVVSEVPGKVERIDPVSPEMLRSQLRLLLEAFPVAAAKTGMLYSSAHIRTVAEETAKPGIALVVDPVMVATSGDPLLEPDATEAYERLLFPQAALLTPNMDETAVLLRLPKGQPLEDLRAAAIELSQRYGTAVLVKGGHGAGDEAVDWLAHAGGAERFSEPFVEGVCTHGTGCTYSAAIAAGLACGRSLTEAVAVAKTFVSAAIRQHYRWGATLDALNHYPTEFTQD